MKIHLVVTVGLAVGLMLLVLALAPGGDAAALAPCDRWVVSQGANSSDCSNPAQPCKTVQYAINQAVDGDVICVAYLSALPGPTTYNERLTINRTLTLDGKWSATCSPIAFKCKFSAVACTPERVVLDAQGLGRVITIGGHIKPKVDCFTITGGDAAGLGGDPGDPATGSRGEMVENDAGGGIYSRSAAPIIVNNVITDNYGCALCPASYGRGGGVFLLDAPATAIISGNLIARNVADDSTWGEGGGIMLRDSDAQVRHNTINENRAGLSAGDGGGIAIRNGEPIIADNEIAGNVAGQSVMGVGGGIYVWSSTTAIIERNAVIKNRAISGPGDASLVSRGGGIYYGGDPTVVAVIRGNTIGANTASPYSPFGSGGGIYVRGLVAPSVVSGNIVDSNIAGFNCSGEGGGISVNNSEVTIEGNNLVDNSATWAGDVGTGGGLYVEGGSVLVRDNTITSNEGATFPGFPSDAAGYGGGIAISNSLMIVQDNLIEKNTATRGENLGVGGGIYGLYGSVRIVRNVIAENEAVLLSMGGLGGGVYLQAMVPSLDSNTILDNVAKGGAFGRGGGVRIVSCEPFTLTNNIIARNDASEYGSGVAIAVDSKGMLAHNTIADNKLGNYDGVYVDVDGSVVLLSNIIAKQRTGIINGGGAGSSVEADTTLFWDNGTNYSAGVVSTNEVAGPAGLLADYHIGSSSGAIDKAPALGWLTWDIDGQRRPMGGAWDVGADEYGFLAYLPVVMRNALPYASGAPR